jgi:cytidylate kinase
MPKDKLKAGFVVTIDGPAASGKTSVSREVARGFQPGLFIVVLRIW